MTKIIRSPTRLGRLLAAFYIWTILQLQVFRKGQLPIISERFGATLRQGGMDWRGRNLDNLHCSHPAYPSRMASASRWTEKRGYSMCTSKIDIYNFTIVGSRKLKAKRNFLLCVLIKSSF